MKRIRALSEVLGRWKSGTDGRDNDRNFKRPRQPGSRRFTLRAGPVCRCSRRIWRRSGLSGWWRRIDQARHEAITLAVQRAHDRLAVAAVADRAAHFPEARVQRRVADDPPGPEFLEQLFLRHDAIGVLDEEVSTSIDRARSLTG